MTDEWIGSSTHQPSLSHGHGHSKLDESHCDSHNFSFWHLPNKFNFNPGYKLTQKGKKAPPTLDDFFIIIVDALLVMLDAASIPSKIGNNCLCVGSLVKQFLQNRLGEGIRRNSLTRQIDKPGPQNADPPVNAWLWLVRVGKKSGYTARPIENTTDNFFRYRNVTTLYGLVSLAKHMGVY